jgi:hypothetical protein
MIPAYEGICQALAGHAAVTAEHVYLIPARAALPFVPRGAVSRLA